MQVLTGRGVLLIYTSLALILGLSLFLLIPIFSSQEKAETPDPSAIVGTEDDYDFVLQGEFGTKPSRTITIEDFEQQLRGGDAVYCTREHTVRDPSGKIVGLETEGPYGEFSHMAIAGAIVGKP